VVEGSKFQNFLRYTFKLPVASTCEDCQLCGTTSPSTAMEKVLELSTLSFSRLFVTFTDSFILFATLFLGNEMSFKDTI
jgi:MinD superfamily P-loop ATPase